MHYNKHLPPRFCPKIASTEVKYVKSAPIQPPFQNLFTHFSLTNRNYLSINTICILELLFIDEYRAAVIIDLDW
jgi:hypothetical protein